MLMPIIDLPWTSNNLQVEVIVRPYEKEVPNQRISMGSLKGCLKSYANPALWEKEQHAWETNIIEKYGNT
jgi:hypothetical protein